MLRSKSYNSRRVSHVKKRELHVKEGVASMKGVPCKEAAMLYRYVKECVTCQKVLLHGKD